MERINLNVKFYKMIELFHKWLKNIKNRDINNFVKLYTSKSIIVPNIRVPDIIDSPCPYRGNEYYEGRVGAFRMFENILLSSPEDFTITDFDITISEENKRIISGCDLTFKNQDFISKNIMMLDSEKGEWKINYHQITLSK